MWKELISAQELIWRLAVRDFSSKYRQSILGISWAVIMPLITVALFIGMNKAGILNISDVGIPYPLYALIGLTVWNILTTGLTASSQAIVGAGSMVVKINFPKIALIIASTGQCIIELIIRIALIGGAFIYFQTTPSLTGIIIGIISLIPFYLFIVGLGFFLSLAGGVLRDISNILTIALSAAMLLTPVVYPIKGSGILATANIYNPLNYFINVPRDLIIKGSSELLPGYAIASAFGVALFYTGWRFFYLAQTKIAERI